MLDSKWDEVQNDYLFSLLQTHTHTHTQTANSKKEKIFQFLQFYFHKIAILHLSALTI